MALRDKLIEVLRDGRASKAIWKIEQLYREVDNPQQFQKALAEGDLETAAEAAGMREGKLISKLDNLRKFGEVLGEEHTETIESIGEEDLLDEAQTDTDG